MNGRNTIGKLNWVENTELHAPTPPLAGEEEAVLVADASGIMGYPAPLKAAGSSLVKTLHVGALRFQPYIGFLILPLFELTQAEVQKLRQKAKRQFTLARKLLDPVRASDVTIPGLKIEDWQKRFRL